MITVGPNGPVNVKGTYNDVSTIQVTNASLPVSATGCTATAATATATVILSPSVHDVS